MGRMDRDLVELNAAVPHMRTVVAPVGPAWSASEQLLADGGRLAELLGPMRAGRFAADARVAASSFFQGYALRVLGTGVGTWLLFGRVPDLSIANTAITLEFDLPAQLGLRRAHAVRDPLGHLVDEVVHVHLERAAGAVRRNVRVGRPLLMGNAGSAIAGVVRDVERAVPAHDRARVRRAAAELFDRLPEPIGGAGQWVEIGDGGRAQRFWSRRNCCLWFLEDPDRRLCDACSLRSVEDRHERFAALARRSGDR
jgi:hypothetical protein